jgi:hypothetical protein
MASEYSDATCTCLSTFCKKCQSQSSTVLAGWYILWFVTDFNIFQLDLLLNGHWTTQASFSWHCQENKIKKMLCCCCSTVLGYCKLSWLFPGNLLESTNLVTYDNCLMSKEISIPESNMINFYTLLTLSVLLT